MNPIDMGIVNKGILSTKGNGLDGVHLGKGANFVNDENGQIHAEGNGRHGVYVEGDDVETLSAHLAEIESLLASNPTDEIEKEIESLISQAKTQLDSGKADKSFLKTAFSTIKDFAAKATGTAVGVAIGKAAAAALLLL